MPSVQPLTPGSPLAFRRSPPPSFRHVNRPHPAALGLGTWNLEPTHPPARPPTPSWDICVWNTRTHYFPVFACLWRENTPPYLVCMYEPGGLGGAAVGGRSVSDEELPVDDPKEPNVGNGVGG